MGLDHHRRQRAGLVIVDYKTTTDASPEAAANLYPVRLLDARRLVPDCARSSALHPDPGFPLVMQSKTVPYLVSVHQHDPEGTSRRHTSATATRSTCGTAVDTEGHLAGVGAGIHEIPRWGAVSWKEIFHRSRRS